MPVKSCSLRCWLSVAVGLFGGVLGCSGGRGDYRGLELIPVTGTVTLDGQPLAGACVVFESPDRTFSEGTTNAAGDYALRYSSEQAGAKPGRKIVRIRGRVSGEGDVFDGGRGEAPSACPEPLPACYNVRSVLSATVAAEHRRFDFALRSKP